MIALVLAVLGAVPDVLGSIVAFAVIALAPVLDRPVMLPDGWVLLLAGFVPFLTAAVSAPTASNGRRSAFAIAASVALAIWYSLTDDTDVDTWRTLIGAAVSSVGTEILAYIAIWQHGRINTRVLPRVGLVR